MKLIKKINNKKKNLFGYSTHFSAVWILIAQLLSGGNDFNIKNIKEKENSLPEGKIITSKFLSVVIHIKARHFSICLVLSGRG